MRKAHHKRCSIRPSVFVSYSHKDRPLARRLRRRLSSFGLRVWIDEGEMRAGDSLIDRISGAILEMDFVLAIISRNSLRSAWCRKEISMAVTDGLGRGKVKVLPLRVDNVRIPPSLADTYCLPVDSKCPDAIIEQLIVSIYGQLGMTPPPIHDIEDGDFMDVAQKEAEVLVSDNNQLAYLVDLSKESFLAEDELRRLRSALRSHEDGIPSGAMDELVADGSIPATQILFKDALYDCLKEGTAGFGLWGLVELGPEAAPWLYMLLTHPENRVVRRAFVQFAWADSMLTDDMRQKMLDTVERIMEVGKWRVCEKRLMEAISKSDDLRSRLEDLIRDSRSMTTPS